MSQDDAARDVLHLTERHGGAAGRGGACADQRQAELSDGGGNQKRARPAADAATREVDFRLLVNWPSSVVRVIEVDAARAAMKEGAERAGVKLLEPIMDIEVVTPSEFVGSVIGDINSRRGQIRSQQMRATETVIHADVPFADLFG